MTPKPTISPLAKTHLRELRERWGVEPTLEESLWIVRLCERVINPVSGERLELIGVPARVGSSDEWLWPITVGAGIWFNELACAWWGEDRERSFWALAFALAHGRDKEILRRARTREAAAALIRDWSLGLACGRGELEEAVDELLPAPPSGKAKGDPQRADWTAIVGEVEAVTGIPADRWLWEVSREETLRAWQRARKILSAMRGDEGHDTYSPADYAVMELGEAKAAIIAAHAAPGQEAGRE